MTLHGTQACPVPTPPPGAPPGVRRRRAGRAPRTRRFALATTVLALAASTLGVATGPATAAPVARKQLSVDLAHVTKPASGAGSGILYGISQDATQPDDRYLAPLKVNAFRGGGWYSGGWIRDGYVYGPATKGEITTIIAQAKRLQAPRPAQYQVILSDLFGSTGGAGPNTRWPCGNGDCRNWITFLDTTVAALQTSGQTFAYDIWNEPDLSIFWGPGVNTDQYFQMWDTAYRELRRLAPKAKIVGPSFAYTPERRGDQWQTFLAHAKAAHTVPDEITNHDEGDVDDPVTVGASLSQALAANGIKQLPLSANEYQPADRQTAGDTAWYLDRLAQSNYTNAMRGNWQCCMIPNLTGLLSQTPSGWAPNGNWWAARTYADMTGSLVATSGQVGTTAIAATKDAAARRAVALIGDVNGYTGPTSVTFSGLAATPWLVRNGQVHVTVYRIPDTAPLYAPSVVADRTVNVADDAFTVPFAFESPHDSYAVYLSWTDPQQVTVKAPAQLAAGASYTVPVTFTNGSGVTDDDVATALAVHASDGTIASDFTVTCAGSRFATCPTISSLAPGERTTQNYRVTAPATLGQGSYRLTATATANASGRPVTVTNSADVIVPCAVGQVCEAELASLSGGACPATDHPGYTGTGFVACFTAPGGTVTQRITVAADGTYTLTARYAAGPNGPTGPHGASVSVDGGAVQAFTLPQTGSWDTWADASVPVTLTAGLHTLAISHQASDPGWFNLDHFSLTAAA